MFTPTAFQGEITPEMITGVIHDNAKSLAVSGISALETWLANPDLPAGPRTRLLFGLAHVLDARGDYARAAQCARQANALALEHVKGRRDYEPARHESFVDKRIQVFNADFFKRTVEGGSDSRRPIFIFGLPRSGSSKMRNRSGGMKSGPSCSSDSSFTPICVPPR